MKLRKVISFVLLAVYLFAAGGSAYIALSCSCLSPHAHIHSEHEACNCCKCASAEHADGIAAFSTPYCGHDHSTEVDLYTGADDERPMRCLVSVLPATLAAECPCPAHVPALRKRPVDRPQPFIEEVFLISQGLRAPPVIG